MIKAMQSGSFTTGKKGRRGHGWASLCVGPYDVGMLFDSLGLACYIAWSYVFWNGSLLFGRTYAEAPVEGLYVIQGAVTALGALLLVLSVRRTAPFRRQSALLAAFAVLSSAAVALTALVGYQDAPKEFMLIGFALSGLGSTIRLGWEEHLSVQGVKRTALCAGMAYLLGFGLFAVVSLLPSPVALMVSALLPFGAFGLLLVAARRRLTAAEGAPPAADAFQAARLCSLKSLMTGIPWKPLVAIGLAYFSYGATRVSGVLGGFASTGAGNALMEGVPALACMVAIALAYYFYRKNALLAFYLAFPLMALAALLPVALDPFAGGTTFCVAQVGAELAKYVVWFLLIDSVVKDGISALLCLALLRFVQWGGSCLGQVAADVLPTPETVTIAILLSLVVALLVVMGSPMAPKGATVLIGVSEESVLDRRIETATGRYKLSPREQEVLAIWATGHTGAYIEKTLFISKNTVKTHLNHIYAKTGTANREQLLELLDAIDG
ncbi:MAG: helix-turn-helix transcriptional regulator [Gordonibacter sp.]|uniref:helix-turn-helix transcriptional regulator n=2 Tax=Gordonibacter sp. TaxID=1968902 RepID=UPI002FC6236C